MTTKKQPAEQGGGGEKQRRRSRSRQPGSIQAYDTDAGKRWRFQIYVPKDPEYPEMGSRRLTRSGFTSTDEANDALQEALNFWLPCVSGMDSKCAERIATDAGLLAGYDGDIEETAEAIGWITLTANTQLTPSGLF